MSYCGATKHPEANSFKQRGCVISLWVTWLVLLSRQDGLVSLCLGLHFVGRTARAGLILASLTHVLGVAQLSTGGWTSCHSPAGR